MCFMDSHPQECPREGDDAFGEELAGVAGADLPTIIERLMVPPGQGVIRQELTAIRLV